MANYIHDMRMELDVPNLRFALARTGIGPLGEQHKQALVLLDAQAKVAQQREFKSNVAFVGTRAFWRSTETSPTAQDDHWESNGETYSLVGGAPGRAMNDILQRGEE